MLRTLSITVLLACMSQTLIAQDEPASAADESATPMLMRGISAEGVAVTINLPENGLMAVDFFAGWAEPSVIAMREYLDVLRFFEPHGLTVMGIAPDRDRAVVAYLQRTRGMKWPVIWDPRQTLTRTWGVTEVPQVVLMNRAGDVVFRGHPLQLKEVLPALLSEATGQTVPEFEERQIRNPPDTQAQEKPPVLTAAGTVVPSDQPQPVSRAKSLLTLGLNYESAGRTDLARINYRKIIRDYPESDEAKSARASLSVLESE